MMEIKIKLNGRMVSDHIEPDLCSSTFSAATAV